MLHAAGKGTLATTLEKRGQEMEDGVWEHGTVMHKVYGKVFAFEVDGYGSHILMDDANIPSLLALPLLGFVDVKNEVYQNTRKMLLNKYGNPYYLTGQGFHGIGGMSHCILNWQTRIDKLRGPHIGFQYAWPMSLLVQSMTSDDDDEIKESLDFVLRASKLGLVHESINVNMINDYTRSWFACKLRSVHPPARSLKHPVADFDLQGRTASLRRRSSIWRRGSPSCCSGRVPSLML